MPQSFLHYEVIQKLGEGGMGLVYLARDTKLNREVALKFLSRHTFLDPTERRRFQQEAQAVAVLNHPHITQVYAIEEIEGELFIVMEYVEGKELKKVIEEKKLTSFKKGVIADQIASAIKAAHDKGIIHRDIKSRNIMMDCEDRIKIMDFGLARIQGTDHITKTGTTPGTTAYMAPELLTGQDADIRSDIWSYGVVLYELFTGKLPFEGKYEPALMYAIAEEELVPPSQINGNVPERIELVIERCLEKRPEDRYADFGEIVTDLSKTGMRAVHQKKSKATNTTYYVLRGAPVLLLLILLIFLFQNYVPWFGHDIPEKKYMAVLPIENIGENPTLQAICDGLAETFSYKLSELEKDRDLYWVVPAREIRQKKINSVDEAKKLFGVNLAILSSIQTLDDSTRLILELVDADNMRRLGTEQVIVPSQNLASLEQNSIRAMLKMLKIDINPGINKSIKEGEPSRQEAYEYYLRGLAGLQNATSQDSLEKAILFFSKSTEIDPEFALAYARLGEAYWWKYKITMDGEFVQQAKTALKRALKLNKDLAPIQSLVGMVDAGSGEKEQAMVHYKRALQIDPKFSAAYRGLAQIYDEQGKTDKAVGTYRKAIELKPDYWEGHKDLGIHYLAKGDFVAAIEQFQQVVAITPKNSTAYSNLGAAYYYSGNDEKARQMFEKSLTLDKNPLTANNLAGIYYTQGNFEAAVKMYKIALETLSNRYDVWGNLATAYDWNGQKQQALQAYLTAIKEAHRQLKVNPNDAQVLADLGAYYSDVNDTSNALKYLRNAIALNAEDLRIRQRAVSTYEHLGKRAEALKWIDSSMIADIESQPELKQLVADPRYEQLKIKFGFKAKE